VTNGPPSDPYQPSSPTPAKAESLTTSTPRPKSIHQPRLCLQKNAQFLHYGQEIIKDVVPSSLVATAVTIENLHHPFHSIPGRTDGVLTTFTLLPFLHNCVPRLLSFSGYVSSFVLVVGDMLMYKTCSRAVNHSDSPGIRAGTGY
jgi:hypothetical protein